MSDKRQKNQLAHSESVVRNQQMVLAFDEEYRGEAPNGLGEGTESLAAKRGTESRAIGEQDSGVTWSSCRRPSTSRHVSARMLAGYAPGWMLRT